MRTPRFLVAVGCFMLLTCTAVHAGIPDPAFCTIGFDLQDRDVPGLMTCPDGDGLSLKYLKITIRDSTGAPLIGVPHTNFVFTPFGGDLTFTVKAGVNATDGTGAINFSVKANHAIPSGPDDDPYWVQIAVVVASVPIGTLNLRCNTVDFDLDGDVDPIDLAAFAGWYGMPSDMATAANFSWSGPGTPEDPNGIDPVDFALFAVHYGHGW